MTERLPAPSQPQEQLIAALVPDNVDRRPAPVRLPTLPAARLPVNTGPDLLISTGRIDRAGRVHERAPFRALGWDPGRRSTLDTLHDLIVIAPDPSGWHVIDPRGAITLPAAAVQEQLLVVHPGVTVARLLTEHYRDVSGLRHDH